MPPSNERKISPWIACSLLFFDNETKAYEGKRALIQLDSEGGISVYGYAVVAKNADGTLIIKTWRRRRAARSVVDSSRLRRE